MHKSFWVLLMLCTASFELYSQPNELPVRYFASTTDFLENNLHEEEATAIVIERGEKYLRVKNVLNSVTKTKSKTGNFAWAIVTNNDTLINMGMTIEISAPGFYMKPDVFGHYTLFILDKETFLAYERARTNKYMGQGALGDLAIHESASWGGNWPTANDEKRKIIFLNRDRHTMGAIGKGKNSQGYLLTKSLLADIFFKNKINKKLEDITVEELIEIMTKLNAQY